MVSTRRLAGDELRVIGALMEKEQTTPDAYPLTLKALRAACNQKTNRDPVTALTEEQVLDALESLRRDVLVWRSAGARVERWEHRLDSRWGLDAKEKALLTVLLLRGAQTPGELRIRTERMVEFDSVEEVMEKLAAMGEGEHPLVRELGRAPGQRESRWCHVVARDQSGEPEPSEGPDRVAEADRSVAEADESVVSTIGVGAASSDRIVELEQRVEDLERRLSAIERELL